MNKKLPVASLFIIFGLGPHHVAATEPSPQTSAITVDKQSIDRGVMVKPGSIHTSLPITIRREEQNIRHHKDHDNCYPRVTPAAT